MNAFGPALPGFEDAIASPSWSLVTKGNRVLVALADRHYTRQTKGDVQCCRPGVNLCFVLSDATAAWVVWRPIPEVGRMDDLEAWECTLFRNEGRRLSSELVREATTLTYRAWGWPPRDGLITAIGVSKTARRRGKGKPPGVCFQAAGWTIYAWEPSKDLAWLRAPRPAKVAR